MRKNIVLVGISIAVLLLVVATFYYPGGSVVDKTAIGYDWGNNYISNLLSPIAVNGIENSARPWAIAGVLLLSLSFCIFFIQFSNRIQVKSAAFVIKYLGIAATAFGFLTVFPALHDIMVTLSSILTLIIFFYITAFVVKSKLHLLKFASIIFLLTFYLAAYMYFTRSYLEYMPIMQKIIFLVKIVWVLALSYLSDKEDFQSIKN